LFPCPPAPLLPCMFRNLTIGALLIGIVTLAAVVSFFWLPHDPNANDWGAKLAGPGGTHYLGTDNLGRDLLARLLVGARGTLFVGLIAVSIAFTLGSIVGAIAGYVGGFWDEVLMRLMDTLYAFPAILMALLLAAIYKPNTVTAMIAIGLATVPVFARIMRASVISVKERDFVEAGRALGMNGAQLLWRSILPNTISPLIVQASLSFAVAVLAEAALSFLGLGTPPRTPSWGTMLQEAQSSLRLSVYPVLVPGLAIIITVLGWSLLGDGLRDLLDPRDD
jgi:peptide/nickel transport system permease protein